jgi:hypothetical protein
MRQLVTRLPAFVILIATTIIALAIGIIVVYVVAFIEKRGRWDQLATPPDDIARLVAGDVDFVVVETADGAAYEVYCRTNDEDYPCLQKVESPSSVYQYSCDNEDFPIPPGQIKDRLLTCIEYEYIVRTQYVLREDGTLWRWNVSLYPYGQLARFIQIITLSLILGISAGVTLLVLRHGWMQGTGTDRKDSEDIMV